MAAGGGGNERAGGAVDAAGAPVLTSSDWIWLELALPR